MPAQPHDEFVAMLTAAQRRLYAFIGTLVVDRGDADDILQETNLAIWKMADTFEPGTDFIAWACRIAHYRVLKQRSAAKRLRFNFAERLVSLLAEEALASMPPTTASRRSSDADPFERHRLALGHCMSRLTDRHRSALMQYYEDGRSLAEIAAAVGTNANAVAQMFHRLRRTLRDCIQRQLAAEAGALTEGVQQ